MATVVIIVAATIRENPLNIVKRTAVPLLVGEAAVLAIAFFRYL